MTATDVFLSHNWRKDELGRNNHQRVSIINKELKRIGYKTWFDEERINGDIDDRMAEGIEQTNCVIVFMTQKYYKKVSGKTANDNCKLEFSHAKRMKTSDKMIVVVMEPCMTKTEEWKGHVGMHLAGKMYMNMTGNVENKTYLRKQMGNLQKELSEMGIKPLNNTNMVEKDPQSGNFLFFTFQYTVKGNSRMMINLKEPLREKFPNTEFFLVRIFPFSD